MPVAAARERTPSVEVAPALKQAAAPTATTTAAQKAPVDDDEWGGRSRCGFFFVFFRVVMFSYDFSIFEKRNLCLCFFFL